MRWKVLFLLPVLFLGGCEYPWTDSNPAVQHKLNWCVTPGKTLESLAWVWTNDREIGNYSALLTDDYRFYWDPNDVGDVIPQSGYQIPQSWDRATDVQSTGNMFAQAYDIRLEVLNADDYDDPNIPGDFYHADNVLIQFYLWPANGDFCYMATGPCDFEFRKVGDEWLISSWYDRSGGTEDSSGLAALRAGYLE
jgi:hypothetical protein